MADPKQVNQIFNSLHLPGETGFAAVMPGDQSGVVSAISKALDAGLSASDVLAVGNQYRAGGRSQVATILANLAASRAQAADTGEPPPFLRQPAGGVAAGTSGKSVNPVIDWLVAHGFSLDEATNVYDANPGDWTSQFLKSSGVTGFSGGGGSAPTPRYSFETVGGQVYRANDLTGTLEPTGISAPGFSSVAVNPRTGDLAGVDASGNYRVIQPGYGFTEISPQEKQAEEARQFGISEGGANQRALLNSATQGFQSINQLAPQLGQLAIDNAKFTRDVTTTPADFLYRAFATRGGTSPLPQVTQSDLINNLANNISQYNKVLAGFNVQVPEYTPKPYVPPQVGFVAPPVQQPAAAPPQATPTPPPVVQPPVQPEVPASSFVQPEVRPQPSYLGEPVFAEGGVTRAPVFKVGDSKSGKPTGFEEIIVNPTNAPLAVLPNEAVRGRMPGFADGTVNQPSFYWDPGKQNIVAADSQFEAPSSFGRYTNPSNIGGATDFGYQPPQAPTQAPVKPAMAPQMPRLSFAAPQLPSQPTVTQDELKALELKNRPPAIASLLQGQMPTPLNVGFAVPTPQMYNALTPDEKAAFATTLATQYNLAPSDVETSIMQRFGSPSQRTARQIGF